MKDLYMLKITDAKTSNALEFAFMQSNVPDV